MTIPFLFFSCLLWRLPTVLQATGLSRAAYYDQQADGLWTHPILIGPRTVAWPAGEIASLNAARIAGQTNDEIRALARQLHGAREHAPRLVAEMCAMAIAPEAASKSNGGADAGTQAVKTAKPALPEKKESMASAVAASLNAQRGAQ